MPFKSACLLVLLAFAASFVLAGESLAPGCTMPDPYTLVGPKDFLRGYDAVNADGSVNMIVEIPTGTTAKWEVRDHGRMVWDMKNGKPRIVQYLGYPGNYGMIPHTRSGDADPLDVIVLSTPAPRGTLLRVRVIGVLKFTDGGEGDDKLVAVTGDGPFAEAQELAELESGDFRNVTTIVRLWFESYKEPGKMVFQGQGNRQEAEAILKQAEANFAQH